MSWNFVQWRYAMAKILKVGDLSEFIAYLTEQIGQPYLWGGQHTKLTPSNYVLVITDKEPDATNRKNAIAYCKKKFDAGATALYAYDCSGLGAYFLYNLKKIISSDTTANGLQGLCDAADAPARGYWVFRLDDKGKAVHIGYMVTDTEVIPRLILARRRETALFQFRRAGTRAGTGTDARAIHSPLCEGGRRFRQRAER